MKVSVYLFIYLFYILNNSNCIDDTHIKKIKNIYEFVRIHDEFSLLNIYNEMH